MMLTEQKYNLLAVSSYLAGARLATKQFPLDTPEHEAYGAFIDELFEKAGRIENDANSRMFWEAFERLLGTVSRQTVSPAAAVLAQNLQKMMEVGR